MHNSISRKRAYRVLLIVVLLAVAVPHASLLAQEKGIAGVTKDTVRAERPRRWAVLIGVDDYMDDTGIGDLKYCGRDMKLLYEVLTGPCGGFSPKQMLLMTCDARDKKDRPTYTNFVRNVPRWLRDARPEDDVLIAFSGHGIERNGKAYLLPSDAVLDNLRLSAVSLSLLHEWTDACRAQRKVLIVDACHAGAGKAPSQMTEMFAEKFRQGKGYVRLASCGPEQKSNEDAELESTVGKGHGVFCYYLAQGLRGPADANKDGRIDADETYNYTYHKVREWARSKRVQQDPWREGKGQGAITLTYLLRELRECVLVVICNEARADIWVNGRRMGRTRGGGRPQEIKLTGAVSYVVSIEKTGFTPDRREFTPGDKDRLEHTVALKTVARGSDLALALDLLKENKPDVARAILQRIIARKQPDSPRAYLVLIGEDIKAGKLAQVETMAGRLRRQWPGVAEIKDADAVVWDAYQKRIGNAPATGATVPYQRRRIGVLNEFLKSNPDSGHKGEAELGIARARVGILKAYSEEIEGLAALVRNRCRRGDFQAANKLIADIESALDDLKKTDRIEPDKVMRDLPAGLKDEVRQAVKTSLEETLSAAEKAIRKATGQKDWDAAHAREKAIEQAVASAAKLGVPVPREWKRKLDDVRADLNKAEQADRPVLDVRSTPPGARVYVNGQDTGKTTPCVIPAARNTRYRVELKKASDRDRGGCYEDIERVVMTGKGGPSFVNETLRWSEMPAWAKGIISSRQQGAARKTGLGVAKALDLGNGVTMKLVLIPAGEFMMGSSLSAEDVHRRFPGGKKEWYEGEHPQHRVRITKPFYMGAHEVTLAQFRRFVTASGHTTGAEAGGGAYGWTGKKWEKRKEFNWRNPSFAQRDSHPVTCVSWNDATAFCGWLSRQTGQNVRLPTEAEWEYACRAGSRTAYPWGNEISPSHCNYADRNTSFSWRDKTADDGYAVTAPGGTYPANAFGLYDMIGNVWEWCADWYDSAYYGKSPSEDPGGPRSGEYRVLRGGSWGDRPVYGRSANRGGRQPGYTIDPFGFRVAASARP